MMRFFGARNSPPLPRRGCLRLSIKCRTASLAGADGVVGSSHRLSVVEQTTRPRLQRKGTIFLVARPPLLGQGGEKEIEWLDLHSCVDSRSFTSSHSSRFSRRLTASWAQTASCRCAVFFRPSTKNTARPPICTFRRWRG